MMGIINHIFGVVQGKHPLSTKRSNKWPEVRKAHLLKNPICASCGGKENLEVHHILPFHLNQDLELDPNNFITLCESKHNGINCHLAIGHSGNFKGWNPDVKGDSEIWKDKLKSNFSRIHNLIIDSLTRNKS